ncbi:MAG TPA: protein translocase subunit SecF [Clostridia bacterium]|nr:protein translocase subunit SecF [Clostridia bacterium]
MIISRRKIWYTISLVMLLVGFVSLAFQGINWGIDFTGGNVLQIQFTREVTTSQLNDFFEARGLSGFSVQKVATENEFVIRTGELGELENKEVLVAFQEEFGEMEVHRNEKIGAVIGQELALNALYALAIAAVLMIIYISFRFELTFGLAAVSALIHDVLVTIGIFSLLQMEVDSAFVAALLTIIGYSINNTIVIFDRVRENLGLMKKFTLEKIVDTSVRQTIVRSINTSLTVTFALVALLVLGGETTKVFALALLIGTIVGTYSSVCVAPSLWYNLKTKLGEKKAFKHASSH